MQVGSAGETKWGCAHVFCVGATQKDSFGARAHVRYGAPKRAPLGSQNTQKGAHLGPPKELLLGVQFTQKELF